MVQNYGVIIAGPTGAGKTAFAEKLAVAIDGEIINGDLGQFYTPLTIGTAKPDWRKAHVAHHLFDSVDEPRMVSVMEFRTQVMKLCTTLQQRNKIPIIVGGSSYYIASLFFPPAAHGTKITQQRYKQGQDLWQKLAAIDQVRAQEIDPHDTYRLQRALDIWQSTGIRPSHYKPDYDPIGALVCIWLERDRQELYERINERTIAMIHGGWIDEVRGLDASWREFLERKKLIGYPQVIAYCRGELTKDALVATIQKKTRNYAKRQITFWRMLKKKLEETDKGSQERHTRVIIKEVHLTHEPIDRYINQLKSLIRTMTESNP